MNAHIMSSSALLVHPFCLSSFFTTMFPGWVVDKGYATINNEVKTAEVFSVLGSFLSLRNFPLYNLKTC